MQQYQHLLLGHTRKEINQILGTVFAMSIVFFLWQWRTADFTILTAVIYFIFVLLVVLISMLVHEMMHHYWAKKRGYRHEYEFSMAGQLISVFLTFFSFAYLLFLAPGGTIVHHDKKLRVGKYYYGPNQKDAAFIAFMGPFANFLVAFLLSFFYQPGVSNPLLHTVIFVNLMIAVFSLLPLPTYDGISIFAFSRLSWFFLFILTLLYSLLLLVAGIHSLLLSVLLAILISIGFWYLIER